MKKYIFLTLLFLVFLPNRIKAYCSDSEVIRLQKLANNIRTSYVFDEDAGRFTVTINNLTNDLVVKNMDDKKEYSSNSELNFKELYSGKHTYIIYAKNKECTTYELTTKYVSLPYYNRYFNSVECDGIENYSYCSKWLKSPISKDVWEQKVTQYKKSLETKQEQKKKIEKTSLAKTFDAIKQLCIDYYYVILSIAIVILGIILIKNYRKNRLV